MPIWAEKNRNRMAMDAEKYVAMESCLSLATSSVRKTAGVAEEAAETMAPVAA